MIYFVLERDSCHFVPNDLRRLHRIRIFHEEIGLECSGLNGEHEIAASFHICISNSFAPHF
jgi:hypothetical protein